MATVVVLVDVPTRYCANPECGKELPADSLPRRRTCSVTCRSRISAAHVARTVTRRNARREAAAARRAQAGPRTCTAPGCDVDISDRDYRTLTCSPAHRLLLYRSRHRQMQD